MSGYRERMWRMMEEDAAQRAEHACHVDLGLEDARSTLAEIWRQHSAAGNDSLRDMTYRALSAVIEAERTMRAADAYVAKPTSATREALRRACATREVKP